MISCECLLGHKHNNYTTGGQHMDKALLEYEMKKRGVSIEEMCSVIGISRSAFYRKCTGSSEFTQSEIQAIVKHLKLESPMGIFFANEVS
jgi:predicted DNA-binding transcriptional regulator AlpA